MALLTITNLTTSPINIQEPTGLAYLGFTLLGGQTLTLTVTIPQVEALEPMFNDLQTSGYITWTAVDTTSALADGVPTNDFPNVTQVTTIYVRTTGSDLGGRGTLALPYRTFARAIRDVPLLITANNRYVIDVTDLGTETLTPGFALPPIKAASGLDQNVPRTTSPFFRRRAAVTIQATPKLWAAISAADANIALTDIASMTADPDDQIITLTLTTPRASWASDALKGAILRATYASGTAGGSDSVVAASTTTTLVITRSAKGTSTFPTGPFQLMEQSCTFLGTTPSSGIDGTAFGIFNVDSFAFNGISFVNSLGGGANICVGIRAPSTLFSFSHCKFTGRVFSCSSAAYRQIWEMCYFTGASSQEWLGVHMTIDGCLFDGVTAVNTTPTGAVNMTDCIWQNCAPLGDFKPYGAGNFSTNPSTLGGQIPLYTNFCRVSSGTSHGAVMNGGGELKRTKITDCAGDGVRCDASRAPCKLTQVVGTGNTGVGVRVLNGAKVQRSVATTVTGTGGDYQVGANAAAAGAGAGWTALGPTGLENDVAAGATSQLCLLKTV